MDRSTHRPLRHFWRELHRLLAGPVGLYNTFYSEKADRHIEDPEARELECVAYGRRIRPRYRRY